MALQWHGLVENPAPNIGMDGIRLDQIHVDAEQRLEVRKKPAEVEQSPISFQIYQESDVALRPVFASSNRTKHTDVPAAMNSREAQDVGLLFLPQRVQRDHSLHFSLSFNVRL